MKIWSEAALSEALGVQTKTSGNVVHFNSSDLNEGDIFIALGNGHHYIKDAIKNGASCIITEKIVDDVDLSKIILVPNTNHALMTMANHKRAKSKAKFIGITGSAGKTSTKDAMYNVLKHFGKTFVSRGNFNNHLGVPLNLASIPDDIEFAVFEMGMNHRGEIRPLANLVQPHIAILTNVLTAHIGNFNSIDEIADEKCDIFSNMDENGIAILNHDNPHYEYCKQKIMIKNTYSFGSSEGSNMRLIKYNSDGVKSELQFKIKDTLINISTKITGRHQASNIGAILLTMFLLGLDLSKAPECFKTLEPVKGRGKKIKVTINGHLCLLIDDCYNANPGSMEHSLASLQEIKQQNKVAILADMKELGHDEVLYHKDLAKFVLDAELNHLYTVGPLMIHLHNELKNKINCIHFNSPEELTKKIIKLIKEPSLILLKGSKSMRLSTLVEFLTNNNSINNAV